MILINLLPVRQLKKRAQTRNEVIMFAMALAVILAIVGTGVVFVNVSIKQQRDVVAQLEAKKKSYNKTLAEIKQIEAKKKQLFAKIEAIKKLKRESQMSVHVIDEIARATPPNSIWLDNLKLSASSLSLKGIALDNTVVADYMNRLESSPYVTGKPRLGSATRKDVAGQNLKAFDLVMGLAPPADSNKETQGSGK
ncbi:MAG: PilN domain-containing protein [Thermodesulfobacteriota bacterium]